MPDKPTTIAFYLPQFYPIPENDSWYTKGFTEWHNVVQAQPLFPGHYQPHLPRDFGFYDLRVPEVREAQARAAKAVGIDAFCYYHYWFEGQRPLSRVIDDMIEGSTPNIPFCLAWANENWSRHWDASQHEVLLRQRFSPEDDEAHGRFLMTAMSHPMYLRVGGKPVFFIYRIQNLPDATSTIERWRELWKEEGLGEVHVVKFDTHGDFSDPAIHGADSAAQFIPHGVDVHVSRIKPKDANDADIIWEYEDAVRHYLGTEQPTWLRHECVVPGWDNSPRRGLGRSMLLHNSTPDLYQEWLTGVFQRAPSDGMVLINAWNEWAEGAHLEPDMLHGDAYLKATARAFGVADEGEYRAPPLSVVPFALRDHFADLYLDAIETQTLLQRRLSRLEATLERQIELVRSGADAWAAEVLAEAEMLRADNERLRARLDELGDPDTSPLSAKVD